MATTTKTIDLISFGLEQGSIGSSGDVDNPARVRTIGYIDLQTLKIDGNTATISLTSSVSGKTPQVDFMGYNSSKTLLCDLYWYNNSYTVNLKSYNGIRYVRAVFKYSNDSTLSVSEITSASLSVSGTSKEWYLDSDDKLMNAELPEPIESNFTPPYPASLWRLDSDDILTLNGEDWSPFPEPVAYLTPPYPATMWYLNVDDDLENALLPEPTLKAFMYPYPASLWYLEDEDLILLNVFLPDEILIPPEPEGGAFYNAESLEYVKIPRTVTSIGVESFKGTNLKKVCISRNCKYYNTSFPSDCQVIFYEDMYDINYNITVGGVNSYRTTEYITHDEESWDSEIP